MLRFIAIATILCAFASPAFAVGQGGGGGACERCEIPYPDMYGIADSSGMSFTPAEAAAICADALDDLPFGMEHGGFVIQWVGTPPETSEDTGRFSCYACINDLSVDGHGGAPFTPHQAGWVALAAYPGHITTTQTFTENDAAYGLRTGYLITIVGESQEGNHQKAAIVRIDPFTGQATVIQEASTRNR